MKIMPIYHFASTIATRVLPQRRELLRSVLRSAITLFAAFIVTAGAAQGQAPEDTRTPRPETDLADWQYAKFGMFIHWGLYAVPAGRWNGEILTDADGKRINTSEWILADRGTDRDIDDVAFYNETVETYENFLTEFAATHQGNVDQNIEDWVVAAKNAGMKYIVVTAKHHDGFCLWDTDTTTYDIVDRDGRGGHWLFQNDVMKIVSDAAREHDIKFGIYYSILDWHHEALELNPDPPVNKDQKYALVFRRFKSGDNVTYEDESGNQKVGTYKDVYVAYMKTQLSELIGRYDPDILWLDGALFHFSVGLTL